MAYKKTSTVYMLNKMTVNGKVNSVTMDSSS